MSLECLPNIENNTLPHAELIEHVTIPNGVECFGGSRVEKIWAVRNIGAAQWRYGATLQAIGGIIRPCPKQNRNVGCPCPGDKVLISLYVIVPNKRGYHTSTYQLHDVKGRPFGPVLSVGINSRKFYGEDGKDGCEDEEENCYYCFRKHRFCTCKSTQVSDCAKDKSKKEKSHHNSNNGDDKSKKDCAKDESKKDCAKDCAKDKSNNNSGKEKEKVSKMKENENKKGIISDEDQGWVRPTDISFGVKLGSGSYGEVFSGTLWGQQVAIKKLKRRRHDKQKKEEDLIEDLRHEVRVLKAQRHPNIVQFLAACYITPFYCIITEYLDGGSLQTMLFEYEKKKKKVSMGRLVNWAGQIARGVNWLHHNRIIHRDLKTCNILVQRPNTLKIADFGLAHIIKGADANSYCEVEDVGDHGSAGTPCYMAPEVIAEEPYGVKADVFSFGIVLLEIITLEYPYDCLTIAQGSWDTFDTAIVDGLRPPIPDDLPLSLKRLIERCWANDPVKRPSMDQVIEILNSIERRHIAERSEVIETMTPAGIALVKEEQAKNLELKQQLAMMRDQVDHLSCKLKQRNQRILVERGELNTHHVIKKKQLKRELKQQTKRNKALELQMLRLSVQMEDYQSLKIFGESPDKKKSKKALDTGKIAHVQQKQKENIDFSSPKKKGTKKVQRKPFGTLTNLVHV